jgi:dTMP kinase
MAGRGKFITFEGGEGAGKSTQARKLKVALEACGKSVVLTREPGGSPGAEEIRKLLVEGAPERWTPLSETLLFIAARADHVARTIEPALSKGQWVISDRFSDSTFVYQGVARELGIETVRYLQQMALGDLTPDLTLILDVEPGKGLARAAGRGLALFDDAGPKNAAAVLHHSEENRFERFDVDFHKRLREGFLEIAAQEPKRCVVIDGSSDADSVAAHVWRAVEERLHP